MEFKISHKLYIMACAVLLIAGGSLLFLASQIRQSDAVINGVVNEQAQVLARLNTINSSVESFGRVRYWYADLAGSWLNESGNEADAANAELQKMLESVDAYAGQNRVLGDSRMADGRRQQQPHSAGSG